MAYCQLVKPNPLNPMYIVSADPACLVRGCAFRVPSELTKTITPFLEGRMSFNVTPKYSLVDLHIGTFFNPTHLRSSRVES